MALSPYFQAFLSILSGIVVALATGYIAQLRENQRWLKDEVYRPLYNELNRVTSGRIAKFGSGFTTKWDEFDPYQKYRVDEDLKESLDGYSSRLADLSIMKGNLATDEAILEVLPDGLAEKQGDSIILVFDRSDDGHRKTYIELERWLEMFGQVVAEANSPSDLRERLISHAEEANSGHAKHFKEWDQEYSQWEEKFWIAFREQSSELLHDIEEYHDRMDEAQEHARELKEEIESRITEGFVAVLRRRVRI